MKQINFFFIFIMLLSSPFTTLRGNNSKEENKAVVDFLNLRFGMFIHYNMGTCHREQWAYPFHDPQSFNPSELLDCLQWAKAAKAAGMQYGVFTTKHHDGFCLWDTSVSSYDIASSSYKEDIVEKYVKAFRDEGLRVGLYFSVWDRHHGIERGNINPENIAFMKRQLTELLTNYGEIICIVIDGWGSKWGKGPDFEELPYHVLADHIHSLQPNCLVINHSCNTSLQQTQIVHYEATHGQHCPYDNTIPSQQGPTLQRTWFWEPDFAWGELKSVESVIEELHFANTHYANYLLNIAPNDKGLIDGNVMKRLEEIGQNISFTKKLHTSLPLIEKVHKNVKVKASSEAGDDFKACNTIDANLFTRWKFDKDDKERWIELDFSQPEIFNKVVCGELDKDVTKFKIEAFCKNNWVEIVRGENMGVNYHASFPAVTAQKYRLTIEEYINIPLIAEITFVKY